MAAGEEKKMNQMKYATFKDGTYIGDFTARELQEKLKIAPKVLYERADTDVAYRKHYTFTRVYNTEEKGKDELKKEWDRVRLLLNPAAKVVDEV